MEQQQSPDTPRAESPARSQAEPPSQPESQPQPEGSAWSRDDAVRPDAARPAKGEDEAWGIEALGAAGAAGAAGALGALGAAGPADAEYGESADEEALRALMRDAVRGLHASPDALDHLRRAIPARRQHRRQAMAGAAAALLLGGMAIPALIHAADTSSSTDAAPANVASSHAPAPGEDGHTSLWDGSGDPSGRPSAPHSGGPKATRPSAPGSEGPSAVVTSPSDTVIASAPACSSAQLGQGASEADAPDSGGRVYGWFRVTNVSGAPCTVPSAGQIQAVAQGAADPAQIQVLSHTAGDPAAGLPPATDSAPVVLAPGEDYEVAFAWVPADTGAPGGCPAPTTPPTTPTPSDPTTDPGTTEPGGASPGTATGADEQQAQRDTPVTTPPASVALNHTPAAGAPVVDGPVIQGACAGTVYTTTAMSAPSSTSGS